MSPTSALYLLLISCTIGTHEKRDVVVTNILCVYLITKIDELVVMVLRVTLEEILTLIIPDLYWKYVVIGRNGNPILYVNLKKALYVYITVAITFYDKIVWDLTTMGFINKPL